MIPSLELLARISAAAIVFALMALWEVLAPRRPWSVGRRPRWPHNLGILVIDALVLRILIPTAAVGAALFAAGNGWGLFHVWGLRLSVASPLGFLALDLAIYAQHVAFHKVPLLWRLHRMHHADLDIDVTTGLRFHPFEILITMLIKIAVVIALGIPPVAVFVFEVVLNATSMFNHGFNLPWWDRLFGTYRPAPEAGHKGMTVGLPTFRERGELRLDRLLTQPFRGETTDQPRQRGADESTL